MRQGFRLGIAAETRWDGADGVGAKFTEFAEARGLPAAIRPDTVPENKPARARTPIPVGTCGN